MTGGFHSHISHTPRATPRRTAVFAMFLCAFLFGLVSFDSLAQNTPRQASSNAVKLDNETMRADIGSHVYVTRDPGKSLSLENYKVLIDQYEKGVRGNLIESTIIPLGSKSEPHWLVFEVTNASWRENWELSFGKHFDGRYGLLEDIFIYDHTNKRKIIDTISAQKNPYLEGKTPPGVSLPVTLEQGQTTVIVMYVVPRKGSLTTIVPRIVHPDYEYMKPLWKNPDMVFRALLAVLAGFFLAAAILRGHYTSLVFVAYFGLIFTLYHFGNTRIMINMALAAKTPWYLYGLAVISGLIASKLFLGIDKRLSFQSRIIITLAVIVLTLSSIGQFLLNIGGAAQIILMFLPPLLASMFMVTLSFARGYSERPGAYAYGIGWAAFAFGSIITVTAIWGLLPPNYITVNFFWACVILQGFLFAFAEYRKLAREARDTAIAYEDHQADLKAAEDIMQTREAAENARLIKMIKHERALMGEMRDREAEQSEQMRLAKDEADAANNAKSAFLAVISHEIRTPMTGILGMVRLLLETSLGKEQKEYASTIKESADAMMALLNDILDFEKIEEGKMDLEHIDFDLKRILNGICTLMTGHAEARNNKLVVNIADDVPQYVVGDPVRLRQVLLNLTGNAIKFTEGGKITIHAKILGSDDSRTAESNTKRIHFAIEDTGIGISKEAQNNLFNPFSQADESVSRKFGGTGLGLAISQKLIETMGGKIEIDSIEGRGSTFFFTIAMPVGDAEAANAGESSTHSVSDKALNILIVEDNEINQRLLKELVSRSGHEVTLAGTGEDAVDLVKTNDFDMVLMDVELPGISGKGATKTIRALEDKEKATLPVIALTGNVRDEDVRGCYAANMNGHLPKPVDPKKLQIQIEKVISGKLDNPVDLNLDVSSSSEYNDVTKITSEAPINESPKKEEIITTPPEAEAAPQEDNKADAHQNADNSVETTPAIETSRDYRIDEEQMTPLQKAAQDSIRQFNPSDMTFTDEELDEDSFEEALSLAEEDTVNRHDQNVNPDSVLDIKMLEDLRSNIGTNQTRELLGGFLTKVDEILVDIDKAERAGDIQTITGRAHELKGMAANFGLRQLSLNAADIEAALKGHEPEKFNVQDLIKKLPDSRQAVHEAVNEWLGQNSEAS